jgi:DNA (cytosine-5)-methyltransferase 1
VGGGDHKRAEPAVVSLFTGAGGLDYGLEAAGFRTCVAVENDEHCCNTLQQNRPDWPVIKKSIFDVTAEELTVGAGRDLRHIDLVAGGPPCQPFSKAGNWARRDGRAPKFSDARAHTVSAFMRIVEELLPNVVLLENVEGFADGGEKSGLYFVEQRFAIINENHRTKYKPVSKVLDAAEFGVPQARKRRFVVAARDGAQFKFPEPTHGEEEGREPFMTAWDALGDELPGEENLDLKGKWADLLPSIPEGQNYCWHTEKGDGRRLFGWRTRYWTFLLKLAKKRPSWTIQAHPGPSAGPFHWRNRKLSIRELCRLQTFPSDVEIVGPRGPAHRQVGNAVPSLLAEVLGREIRRQLLGHDVSNTMTLMPERRVPVPRAHPCSDVPAKYLSMIGEHPAHPGPGEGPGAKKRNKKRSAKKREAKRRLANRRRRAA